MAPAPYHSPAMAAVLAIPELLEIILLHVDVSTLLVSALRVNRKWNSFIASSPALQQALFFSPVLEESATEPWCWDPERVETKAPAAAAIPTSTSNSSSGTADSAASSSTRKHQYRHRDKRQRQSPRKNQRPTFNPLLLEKFGTCFFDFGPTYGFFRRTESFYTLPWTARPHQTVPTDGGGRYHPLYRLVKPTNLSPEEIERASEDRARFTRKGASWRRMLVSQPPPPAPPLARTQSASKESSIGYLWWRPDGPYGGPEKLSLGRTGTVGEVDADVGVLTMGRLYDLVQYHAGHHELRSLWFRVTWGSPKPPFVTMAHQRGREELVSSSATSAGGDSVAVVVEFLEFEDDTWFSRRESQCMDNFDKSFRCEEARPPVIDTPTPGVMVPGSSQPDDYKMDILQAFVVSSI